MTHTKFRLINTTLRFDDKLMRPSRHREDKLAPIRSLWEKWTRLPMLFNPEHNSGELHSQTGENVILLSSKHRDPAVTEHEKRKPLIIADYNHCKGDVDNLDKVVGSYSCRRMTHWWPQVLFYNIIDVSAFNAFKSCGESIHPVHQLLLP
ncbi:PiggyBac transposable element-derived protein 4 [Dissostichus eleginoides]|uniref:PiggyBac transposable element-derived protein 4 n=1 Tax=Dissostichus eleginoides TaxID=100907 RepID=A0AAD9FHU0_DISEL|nr:PiggyBac transposable element-derived protein 4 [Dissostichus eleginoides]